METTRSTVRSLFACALFVASTTLSAQGQGGRIEGRVVRAGGAGVEGATVLLQETAVTTITGPDGAFVFEGIRPGDYSLLVTLGSDSITISKVVVRGTGTVTIEERVDWSVGFAETLTVVSTSRRPEAVVEAPASVTRLSAAEIEDRAAHAQLPKLMEFAAGAQVTQSGIYDFNFNTRGFNSSLNRRVAVLIDGRNPAAAFFAAQEWAAIGFSLDDLASAEFVRGPSAALYGANASSGILNLITKQPRTSRGGTARMTVGQLATANVDLRWAGRLGSSWYGKAQGGLRRSGHFAVSRRGAAEYTVPCGAGRSSDCLPQEVAPPAKSDNEVVFGSLRGDRYFDNGMVLTVEGGLATVAGPIIQTGVGRTQVTDVKRPWARFSANAPHVNAFVTYTGRDAPGQLSLTTGTNSTLTSHTFQFEAQTDRSFRDGRVMVVLGASSGWENIDSFDETLQRQSLLLEPIASHQEAMFGQVDWMPADSVRFVLAARGDFSSLHDARFSPRASVVYSIGVNHSARLTYHEAFQVPNHSELFLQADAAPPANLSTLNALCVPFGVDCGFGATRILAVGNPDLQVETIRTFEIGYKALIARRLLVTADYHRSRAADFITDLLPQMSTPLGRINARYGPWKAPSGLPTEVAAQIRALAPAILSTNADGSNVLAAVSYANYGRVNTQGSDVSANVILPSGWRASSTYSWFDFEVHHPVSGLEAMILPNAPEHSMSVGAGYSRGRVSGDLSFRWVDRFRWAVGPFQGDVMAYTTADLTAIYRINRHLSLGLNVANVFDDRHWETFGGDVLRRRALASIGYSW